jgi:hypothetical protein
VTSTHRPRILFIGLAESTHTHAWISLLDPQQFDVRLHAVHGGPPAAGASAAMTRAPTGWARLRRRVARRLFGNHGVDLEMQWLAREIRSWHPHIIHTLGLEPASYFYLDLRRRLGTEKEMAWVVTARGGPELALQRLVPRDAMRISEVMKACDQLIVDNDLNYEYAVTLGLAREKVASLGSTPGVGGVDVRSLRAQRTVAAARSRLVLMPKAYECPASKVLPVFEALKLCWDRLQPCEIHFTAATPEAEMWFATLPAAIRAGCTLHERVSRDALLKLMGRARIMLAPSLTDGVPNVLYEAMASGCAPIVSPIETLQSIVREDVNVLYARNLYPEEIAAALVRGMSDDRLIESIVAANAALVERLADRERIRCSVADYYRALATRAG